MLNIQVNLMREAEYIRIDKLASSLGANQLQKQSIFMAS